MSLKDDLIAAKALIDTPEKYRSSGGVWQAMLHYWRGDTDESDAAYIALEAQVPRQDHHLRYYENDPATTHGDIMALFQRAIDAADMNAKPQVKP